MSDAPPPRPSSRPLFDSHSHLSDPRFADDLAEVLRRAAGANVTEVLVPASEPDDASRAAAIARAAMEADESGVDTGADEGPAAGAPRIFWSAGVHPHAADGWERQAAARVAAELDAGAVAVGETGLDFHYENSPRERQLEAFAAQAELARRRGVPLIVHSREADSATASILLASGIGPERVILHCFSAGEELFRAALDEGWYISFSGLITFKTYATPGYLSAVPRERVLVETDAPYLAPVPWRGRRNEPAFLTATVARLAEARGMDAGEAAALTRANARRVFGLDAADVPLAGTVYKPHPAT